MLKYSKKFLSLQTVQNMYLGIVEQHIRYCCSVWGCAGDTILQKLQKMQNRTARIVTNRPFDKASLPLISQLGWLNIREMIDFETATMVYKSLHGLAPPYNRTCFTNCLIVGNEFYGVLKQILRFHDIRHLMDNVAFRIAELLFGTIIKNEMKITLSF